MRVVVVGRSGQVAQSLLERGPIAGHEIVALGRPDLDLSAPQNAHSVLAGCDPADIIVNAAAYTAVDKAESEAEQAYLINSTGAAAIADAAHALGVPLIHISTDYVFDGDKPTPYVETDPVAPKGVYGQSKCAGEDAVRAACPRHAILRTAWVFSPFGSNFVKTMLRLAKDREEVRVVADQVGCPTSALDLADAILQLAVRLMTSEEGGFGTFHCAASGDTSWADFAEAVFAASARRGGPTARVMPISTREYPTTAERPANSRLDCSKLADVHGIRQRHFAPAVDETVERLLSASRSGDTSTRSEGR